VSRLRRTTLTLRSAVSGRSLEKCGGHFLIRKRRNTRKSKDVELGFCFWGGPCSMTKATTPTFRGRFTGMIHAQWIDKRGFKLLSLNHLKI